MTLSHDDIREILRIIDESDLSELQIETDSFSLHVRKGQPAAGAAAAAAAPSRPRPHPRQTERPAETPTTPEAEPAPTDGLTTITAPMLGTFYRAEGPGQPPFVEVGKAVEPDTIVCIIEVMKMMNSVPAGVSGTIAEVVAENSELVEYGQPLFRVQPA
jgi:acetyl-CoA carboxylase biotin carboxyl carrier protein